MQSEQARRLGAYFTAASLFEVCVTPSPGLVSPRDTGAHTDMNHLTFMMGSSVLAPYFAAFAEIGLSAPDRPPRDLLDELRRLGRQAEKELMEATANVNTQRGQLFLLGIASGVAGLCLARGQRVPSPEFYAAVREACGGLCARELAVLDQGKASTKGEMQYLQRGITGARGEAEAGFPVVEMVGYPAFEHGLRNSLSLNDSGVHALLSIMSVLVDTTVLGRLGSAGIDLMHETGIKVLNSGSVFTRQGRQMICEAHSRFSEAGLSPGGAADLLALSMALYFVDHGFPRPEMILGVSLFGGMAHNVATRV